MTLEELRIELLKELAGCKGRASLFLEIEGETIEYNSNEVFQSASLIKLPILFEALRQMEAGQLKKESQLAIGEGDKIGDTGVLQAMRIKKLPLVDYCPL